MVQIDPGLAITVVGAALTLTIGLVTIYNGRRARESMKELARGIGDLKELTGAIGNLIVEESRMTREMINSMHESLLKFAQSIQELIKEESRLTRKTIKEESKLAREIIKEEYRLTREMLDRMDRKLDAMYYLIRR